MYCTFILVLFILCWHDLQYENNPVEDSLIPVIGDVQWCKAKLEYIMYLNWEIR